MVNSETFQGLFCTQDPHLNMFDINHNTNNLFAVFLASDLSKHVMTSFFFLRAPPFRPGGRFGSGVAT